MSEKVIYIDYPLRENVNASFVLPKDLTLAEVKRLEAFMLSLIQEEPSHAG